MYRCVIAGAALIIILACAATAPPTRESDFLLALVVGLLVIGGRSIYFQISSAGASHMGTPALLIGVLLLDPTLAIIAIAVGAAISDVMSRRRSRSIFFNAGQATLQAVVAIGFLHTVGWNVRDPQFGDPIMLGAILVGGSMAIVVSALLVSLDARIENGGNLAELFSGILLGGDAKLYLIDLSKICFGLIAAMLVTWTPFYVLLILIPVATMSQSISKSIRLSRRLENALAETEENLAEAQRLAKLGSWEWEFSSDYVRCSEQIYEITGLKPDGANVALDDIRQLLRLSDRHHLEQIIAGLCEHHGSADFDHEIVRADGSIRHIHNIIAWAPANERVGERLVGTMHDITVRKALEIELRYQAFHDGLTGLPNREQFLERLAECLRMGHLDSRDKAVIFLDLDYFKQINDCFGHEVGDLVLIEVGRRLSQQVSQEEMVARLSGDEFTILVCDRGIPHRIESLTEQILEDLRRPVMIHDHAIPVTASAGLVYIGARHRTPSDVLREADTALYRAKSAGRNRLRIERNDPILAERAILRGLA